MCVAEGSQQAGICSPCHSSQDGCLPSLKLPACFTEIIPWEACSLLQVVLNSTRVQSYHPSTWWATHFITLGSATSSQRITDHRFPLPHKQGRPNLVLHFVHRFTMTSKNLLFTEMYIPSWHKKQTHKSHSIQHIHSV